MLECVGYGATAASTPVAPFSFNRRDPGPDDVVIKIAYLRRLPFGPPSGPQRVAQHRLSLRSRP